MTSFETTLKNYLDNRAKSDSAFAEKYANPAKKPRRLLQVYLSGSEKAP